MYANSYQGGLLSVLYSIGSKPLKDWNEKVVSGSIQRVQDEDIRSSVVEIRGSNVITTYISLPKDAKMTLGIKLPFLVMIVKNLNDQFTFEAQVVDDTNTIRRLRASNYRARTQVSNLFCSMPMTLDDGWNQIQFNLADFTKRAFGTNYKMTQRLQIHANCRLRRVFFTERLYSQDELPPDYKLRVPVASPQKEKGSKRNQDPAVREPENQQRAHL